MKKILIVAAACFALSACDDDDKKVVYVGDESGFWVHKYEIMEDAMLRSLSAVACIAIPLMACDDDGLSDEEITMYKVDAIAERHVKYAVTALFVVGAFAAYRRRYAR